MRKQMNPARTCTDCMHCLACHLWSSGAISNSVAPKCPQFKPARYASLAELQDLYRMYKGELVPVRHGRHITGQGDGDFRCSICGATITVVEGGSLDGVFFNWCPNCGAKMDGGSP